MIRNSVPETPAEVLEDKKQAIQILIDEAYKARDEVPENSQMYQRWDRTIDELLLVKDNLCKE